MPFSKSLKALYTSDQITKYKKKNYAFHYTETIATN